MPKRILQIIPTLDRAGAEKQLVLLSTNLPAKDYEVHVCALTRGGPLASELESAGIPTTVIGKRWKTDPLAYAKLKKHIKSLNPDLVQTWLFAAGAYGRTAARACGVKHLVHTERCIDQWKASWQWTVDRRLAKTTDCIVANSTGVLEYCIANGLPAEKLKYIPNAVPNAKPSDVAREALLDELKIPHDTKLIGVVGRLWPQKRVKELIWAFEMVAILHPNAKLLIIGDGPQRKILERYIRLVSNEDRVRLLGARNDVWRIMPHLDVFWNGSGYEGMPNSVMEAMAASVPVVASDIPGNRDLVVPEKTGYLVPVSSRAGFARATDELLTNKSLVQSLGTAGRERMQQEFSMNQLVESYSQLYRKLLF